MIRISVTGPESTGKSWLAESLAANYGTIWVPEYAREYLGKLGRPYSYGDILSIAKGQLGAENKAAAGASLLFCDTDLLVTYIWCTVKYGKCHHWISQKLSSHTYDLYLLCDTDLPWEYDPLREHPGRRRELFELYRQQLDSMNAGYHVISGTGEQRLQNAVTFVDQLLKTQR